MDIAIQEVDIAVAVAACAVEPVVADLAVTVDLEAASAAIGSVAAAAYPVYPESFAEDSFAAEVLVVVAAEGIRTAGLRKRRIRVAAFDFLANHRCCRIYLSWNNQWLLSHSTRTPTQAFFWLAPTSLDKKEMG